MDAGSLDELRALRARAYGPSADIHDDPAALRRLEELEALRGAPVAVSEDAVSDEVDVTVEESEPVAAPPADVEPDGDRRADVESGLDRRADVEPGLDRRADVVDAQPTPEAAPPRRLGTRVKLLWAFTVVAAAAIAASITYAVTYLTPVSVSSGAEQIASLEPSRTIEVPTGWFGAGASSLTFEYHGLAIFEASYGMNVPGTDDCFTIVAKDQLPDVDQSTDTWSIDGSYWGGCGVGNFPSTVELRIDERVPEELRSQFADGDALQFVFDGERVGVFLDRAG
ncbi:hypothetical protein ACQ143_04685 [Microbacterium sp. MC2]